MLVPDRAAHGVGATLAEAPKGKPAGRRLVQLTWDDGAKPQGVELRPGIVVIGDVSVTEKRVTKLYGSAAEKSRPTLADDEFVEEIEHLLTRIEAVPLGKRLVDFFAACGPVGDANGSALDGDYGPDNAKFGINPRRLRGHAVNGSEPVAVNLVILQDRSLFDDHCHGIPAVTGSPGTNGYGKFATVVFSPRNGLLIDRVSLAPEIGLAHEMVHAVHMLSGTMDPGGHADVDSAKTPKDYAEKLFLAQTGRAYNDVLRLKDPANKPEWDKLTDAQKKATDDLIAEFVGLVHSARQILAPVTPSAVKADEIFFQSPVVALEEARTHGNDVTAAWIAGTRVELNLRRLAPSRRHLESDAVAAGEVKRIEEYQRRNPADPLAAAALQRATRMRQLRREARDLDEVKLAAALKLPTRASYVPTLSKLEAGGVELLWCRAFFLSKKRADIPDQAFKDLAPFDALIKALPPDPGAPSDPPNPDRPTPVADLKDYAQKLAAWLSGTPLSALGGGWKPGDHPLYACTTRERVKTVTVAPSTVEQPLREQATEVTRDALAHPGTPVSAGANDRLRPAAMPPLPARPGP